MYSLKSWLGVGNFKKFLALRACNGGKLGVGRASRNFLVLRACNGKELGVGINLKNFLALRACNGKELGVGINLKKISRALRACE